MTKEEKIKEAWDNKDGLNTNSWAKYYTYESVKHALTENGSLYMPSDSDFDSGSYLIPPQIIGIKNNNGWIKIESEADLPKYTEENLIFNFITSSGKIIVGYADKYTNEIYKYGTKRVILGITHYQSIKKPKTPIY